MTTIKFPPVPPQLTADPILFRWLQDLVRMVSGDGSGVSALDLSSVKLSDIGGRDHSALTKILGADPTGTDTARDKHVSDNDLRLLAVAAASAKSAATTLQSTVTGLQDTVGALQTSITALQARAVVRNGGGAPSASLGGDGDLYINNSGAPGSRLYVKVAGAWIAVA